MRSLSKKIKNKLWVSWKGRIYALPLQSGRAGSAALEEQELVAPYSCKILRVLVQPGQSIKAGDPVVVVEAMKMEYSFASPKAGTIKKVLVEAGKIVTAGTSFVEWA